MGASTASRSCRNVGNAGVSSSSEHALDAAPQLSGRITARFVIGGDGSVSHVDHAGGDLPDASMVECVLAAFSGLAFPRPEGGTVTAVVPLDFLPS